MNKKVLSILIIVVVAFWTIYNSISLANTTVDNEKSFISVNNTDISLGENLLINLNMSKINYENFKVDITSNIQMDGITMTDDSIDGAEVSVNNNEEMTLTGNKTTMNVEQVTLKYVIPNNVTVGSKIVITAKLTNVDDLAAEAITKEITINVVENQNNDNTVNNNIGDNTGTNNIQEGSVSQDIPKAAQSTGMTSSEMQGTTMQGVESSVSTKTSSTTGIMSGSSSSSTQEEEVVYNGSNDNYLSSLSISGYDLNTDFNKTNKTYFITAKDTSSLNISATTETSSATVKVYGESELKEGTNKILVSVTAENGNVRTYRIYVTIES